MQGLTELITPKAEHVLDWFHIATHLTKIGKYGQGVAHHQNAEVAG